MWRLEEEKSCSHFGRSPALPTRRKGRALTAVTSAALLTFFAGGVTVLGTRIHQPDLAVEPQLSSDQMHKVWAQIWTASEVEAERCLQFKEDLARKGM